jgi:hypothetical protein
MWLSLTKAFFYSFPGNDLVYDATLILERKGSSNGIGGRNKETAASTRNGDGNSCV